MGKTYCRYRVTFGSYQGKIRADVLDLYWDKHNYAFFYPGSMVCTSYSDLAAKFVQYALDHAPELFHIAVPGTCYQILTDGVFGKGLGIRRV